MIVIRDKKIHLRINGNQNLLFIEGSPFCSMDYFMYETVQLIINAMQNGKITYSDVVAYVVDNHEFTSDSCFVAEYAYNVLSDLINVCSNKIRNRAMLNGIIDRRRLEYPGRVELAVTYDCNNRCYFCYADCPRSMRELSTNDWMHIIDKLIIVGIPHLIFTGGEATLREDLSVLIDRGSKSGLVTGLVTNGRLLTYERCCELKKSGLDYVRITVESHSPDSHDSMTRIKGSCVESWLGIENCVQSGIRTSATITVMKDNVSDISDTLIRLGGIGVSLVTINGLICSGLGKGVTERVDSKIMAIACKKALNVAEDNNMSISFVTPYCHEDTSEELVFMGINSCSAAKDNITIQPDGSVIPCQSWFHENSGNILTDEWCSIWNHETMKKARRSHLIDKCQYCDFRSNCDGGCPLEKGGKYEIQ